jgi:hypothetical protein
MTDTTRDLIQRMARELDFYRQLVLDDCTSTHPFANEARAYLDQPELTLTVEDCSNMHKHRFNFLDEDCFGKIVLEGSFTREDLIEIANTVPTEA